MKMKITDPSRHSVYVESTEGHFSEVIRDAAQNMATEGGSDKQLYFIVDKDADLSLEVIHHICAVVVAVFGDSLVWDIVTELPEPLSAEDGILIYLFINERWTKF